jgi:hypothetical protein
VILTAIKLTGRLAARSFHEEVFTSGLFDLILEIVRQGAPPQVISDTALVASIMLSYARKNPEAVMAVLASIPVDFFGTMFVQELTNGGAITMAPSFLSLFTQVLVIHPDSVPDLARPPVLTLVRELMESPDDSVRRVAVSCAWNSLKCFSMNMVAGNCGI